MAGEFGLGRLHFSQFESIKNEKIYRAFRTKNAQS